MVLRSEHISTVVHGKDSIWHLAHECMLLAIQIIGLDYFATLDVDKH